MPQEVQRLLSAIDAGEIGPANAASAIEQAGGLGFILCALFNTLE